ncbi:T9SS type A sorting domain-containing protein [Flavobacterium saccharophilum]|uniref:Delta-60 repeat domain-containing protein/Por secretion system C-terminal sorting domain-containing protein n=1 Tax=Flavobacterium saccharophilum TaxID=29534 RepID=A0A1M7EGZ1_9FLAO|nr:T9SS type A sorting domain-containing protein [Flavobacterium saccharophilum]SHL91082.1 delta-60 repeat domain-containing protein/Por secretion system C-terminal sorting domain-containing protein [Flavobacterium saccharophilum]
MKKFYSLFLLTFFGILSSYAQTFDETFVQPTPYKAAQIAVTKELPDGRILLGGKITFFKDKKVNNLIRLNADYSLDETFLFSNPDDLIIRKVQLQSNGDIIVVAHVDNPYNNAFEKAIIFQLTSNGEVKAKITGLEDITSIAIQNDDKVLVSSGSVASGYVHRYNSDLSVDATFRNDLSFNKKVSDVKVFGNAIYVAGIFTEMEGIVKNSLVRLNSDGTLDATFDVGLGAGDHEFSMMLQDDGKILISGNFTRVVNDLPTYNMCRLNLDGTLDKTFLSQYYGYSNDFVVKDSFIYLETFLNDDVLKGYHIIKLNNNGTLNKQFTPIKLNEFWYNNFSLNLVNETLFYNNCEYTGNKYGLSIADLNGNTIDSSELKPSQFGSFQTGGNFDGKLVVKGDFVKINDVETFGIGLLDENGGVDKSFIFPKYLGDIKQVQIIDNTTIFVSTKDKLIKLDNSGNIVKDFDYKTDSKLLGVEQFRVLENGKILITDQWGLYLLNAEGKQETEYKLNTNSDYWTTGVNFEIQNDKILCKAQFESFGAGYVPKSKLMRFNMDGTPDSSFKIGESDSGIAKIKTLNSGEIIVAGRFLNYNEISTSNQFLKLSKDGEVDLKFIENLEIPKIGISGGKYYDYRKIEEMDGVIYVTQGDSNITAIYLDGIPKNDFEMPTVIDSITDIIPLENQEEGSTTDRKSKTTDNTTNYMIAIGTNNVTKGLSSVIVKVNLGAKTLSVNPTPEVLSSSIQMYPIPVKEKLTLSFSRSIVPTKIAIYSVNGAEVYTADLKSTESPEIDMSQLNSGIYFVKVFSDAGTETKKIVKK